jgi:hypothetical protein
MAADVMVWDEVPDGSTLWLHVAPPGPFIARARVVRSIDGVPLEELAPCHVELTRGPHPLVIERGVVYSVRISVHCPTHARTVIRAWIEAPSGERFKAAFEYAVDGLHGDVIRATLVVFTTRLDLGHHA